MQWFRALSVGFQTALTQVALRSDARRESPSQARSRAGEAWKYCRWQFLWTLQVQVQVQVPKHQAISRPEDREAVAPLSRTSVQPSGQAAYLIWTD